MDFLKLIDYIIEQLKKDYKKDEFEVVEVSNDEYDILRNGRYIGISIRDGNLGEPEKVYEILKSEIDFFITERCKYYFKSEQESAAKLKNKKKINNDGTIQSNSGSADRRGRRRK